jgi:hypothetical protein
MSPMTRTVGVLFLAASLVFGLGVSAGASTRGAHSAACKAGLMQLRADQGRFDNRYDHILGSGIIGTACAQETRAAVARPACAVAIRMFWLASPLFKTHHDRDLGRGIMAATCAGAGRSA